MEIDQILQNMCAAEWKSQDFDNIEATIIAMGGETFSLTDRNKARRKANAAAIVQAVNGTWLKGYDPNKMADVVLALESILPMIRNLPHVPKVHADIDKGIAALKAAKL